MIKQYKQRVLSYISDLNFQETFTLPFELDESYFLKGIFFNDYNTYLKYKIEHRNDRLRFPKWKNSEEEKNIQMMKTLLFHQMYQVMILHH